MFNHEELKVFFRDQFVEFQEATISISCTGFLYGLGVFTGMRAHYNEKQGRLLLFRPEDHYRRFKDACKLFQYKGFIEKYDYQKFLSTLLELIRINNLREDVYIRVTNFTDENKISPKFVGYKDSLCAFVYPLGDYVPTTGMKCMVSSWTRIDDNAMPARAKINGVYVNTGLAKTEALQNGYDEAIFLDRMGHVVEGSAENIFVVFDGEIVTPPVTDNILEGITRRSVIEIASNENISVVERSIDRTELYKAEEIFLTGTGAKVSPVVQIGAHAVGNGEIGSVCSKIRDIYSQAVRGEDQRYQHWLVDVYEG